MLINAHVFALMLISALVLVGQLARWPWTWLGVALYWAVLLSKNILDWKGRKK